jgi:hypothetical protein
VALDEPLGAEFSCSRRFVSHCLERDIWDHEVARFAIDLWLRAEAVADGFAVAQVWRPVAAASGTRARLREAVQQVALALVESLREHESFWLSNREVVALRTWGNDPGTTPDPPSWDYEALAEQARQDIREIRPLLESVLETDLLARLIEDISAPAIRLDDELWVRVVYAFATATRRGMSGLEHLAGVFVPLYLWRAAAFMTQTSQEADAAVQARLDLLCGTFQRLKPVLVDNWSAEA